MSISVDILGNQCSHWRNKETVTDGGRKENPMWIDCSSRYYYGLMT